MKRVLIIGAGIGQLFLARKIKARGHFLITVTLPGNQPVIEIADKVYYVDVFDKEGVLQVAKDENIDAVISDQNDLMMPTVAYVAEKMGLPGLRITQVDAFCNKNHYRDNCDKLGIPVPRHIEVKTVEIPKEFESIAFPWIVKPADSQSSVGVAKVNNRQEYFTAIGKALEYSKSHTAILEEFFEGQEIVVEGFIYQGKYYNLGFADRKYFDLDRLFIPSQTIFPSVIDEDVKKRIVECEEKMAKYVNPEFAIVHSEYLYNANNGSFRVVESALRGGGVYISSHLIPLHTDIDINNILLDCVLGNEIDVEAVMANCREKASGYICFYLPEGEVIKTEGLDSIRQMECVKMVCLDDVKVGDKTPPLTHKGQRLGPIIVLGDSREDIESKIKDIQDTLDIRVKSKNGEIFGVKWN